MATLLIIAENNSVKRKIECSKGEPRWCYTMSDHGSDNDSHNGQNDNILSLNMWKNVLSISTVRVPKGDPPKCTMRTLSSPPNQP
uniref:Uncharacterized protein n=1 Tax=Solanum tuberosum TaxID=4113 RepID=M1DTS3_SOLTU